MLARHARKSQLQITAHIKTYRASVIEFAHLQFDPTLTDFLVRKKLISRAVTSPAVNRISQSESVQSLDPSCALDSVDDESVGLFIHKHNDKTRRRQAFDDSGSLTQSAFSISNISARPSQAGAQARRKDNSANTNFDDANNNDSYLIGTTTTTGGVGDTKQNIGKRDKWLAAVATAFGRSTLKDTYDRLCATRTPSAKKKSGPARAGAKQVKEMERLESTGPTLNSTEATFFHALSARANYLAQDRPDIAFATKELCCEFCQPSKRSYERLKRVGRDLAGHHRMAYKYKYLDAIPEYIEVYCDTVFAGCKATRRSTSGGVACLACLGPHSVQHWSKTQSTVSLSSGEAELRGICDGVSQGLGLQSICRDLGFSYKLRIHSDATAAIGIARRRGMGKIRHLDCSDL